MDPAEVTFYRLDHANKVAIYTLTLRAVIKRSGLAEAYP